VRRNLALALLVTVTPLVLAMAAHASVIFQLEPTATAVDPGEIFSVSVEVPIAGDGFNGYDAVLNFDATKLEVILPSPPSSGEGPLFTESCGLRFLDLSQDGQTMRVRVSHVVLCAGLSLTGPGTTYTLQFRAREVQGLAVIELIAETQAYDAGYLVPTERGTPLSIQIGDVTAAPPPARETSLRAIPNPFNPSTELHFDLESTDAVTLAVFDLAGRHVRTLLSGQLPAGAHRVRWDGRDAAGRFVASGIYLAGLDSPRGHAHTRLVLVR
jgi:hypothetical protein